MSTLVLAVPSKGRLQENAEDFFARVRASTSSSRAARANIAARSRGLPASRSRISLPATSRRSSRRARCISASPAKTRCAISWPTPTSASCSSTKLGFGEANVVVAVPQAWIDVRTMADLDDVATAFRATHGRKMRVATKYMNLTRAYFAKNGIIDYRIVESLGATEGAPAAGTAEMIVDITTTGATLAANGLKVLDDGIMLRSQANLIAANAAPNGARASARPRGSSSIALRRKSRARLSRGAHALARR